jgi:hypothetical protein
VNSKARKIRRIVFVMPRAHFPEAHARTQLENCDAIPLTP